MHTIYVICGFIVIWLVAARISLKIVPRNQTQRPIWKMFSDPAFQEAVEDAQNVKQSGAGWIERWKILRHAQKPYGMPKGELARELLRALLTCLIAFPFFTALGFILIYYEPFG